MQIHLVRESHSEPFGDSYISINHCFLKKINADLFVKNHDKKMNEDYEQQQKCHKCDAYQIIDADVLDVSLEEYKKSMREQCSLADIRYSSDGENIVAQCYDKFFYADEVNPAKIETIEIDDWEEYVNDTTATV